MKIIRVTGDRLELAEQSAKLFSRKYAKRTINRHFFKSEDNILVVAVENNEVIGSVYGYLLDRYDRETKQLFIYSIDVLKDHQRRGVGKSLILGIMKCIENNNYENAFVFTHHGNIAAKKLYRSTGAKEVIVDEGKDVLFVWDIAKKSKSSRL